ncbi:MAG: hypothetical protein HQK55_06185, partial [Deltaproteobacteria bacterium]|nr:hypothetical protein [Deltaproteobacteria bacterium]
MPPSDATVTGRVAPDYSLVMTRLEREILQGDQPEKYRQVLSREDIWTRMSPAEQIKWAQLSQMAGVAEVALKVLAHLNAQVPDIHQAWLDRMDLLLILDRRQELTQVLAAAKNFIPEDTLMSWRRLNMTGRPAEDQDLKGSTASFDTFRHRQQIIQHYLDLFAGREDCHARQWFNKDEGKSGYVPVHAPLTPVQVEEHISGRRTYGFYLMRSDSTVKTAVIDADLAMEFRSAKPKNSERDLIRRESRYLVMRIKELG